MFESLTIELGLDEHHRLAAQGERDAERPQPGSAPAGGLRRALARALVALAARLDPAARSIVTGPHHPAAA